jgi:hypothetical protein
MRTLVSRLIGLGALLLVGCSASGAPDEATTDDPTAASEQDLSEKARQLGLLHVIGTYDGVELRSDVAIAGDVARRACAEAHTAYAFDGVLLGVTGRPALAPPFTMGLASEAVTQGRDGAAAIDPNEFLAALRFYLVPKDQNGEYMLGHELTHMTMMRLGANVSKVPVYIFEGIATSLGIWFAQGRGAPTAWAPNELATVTHGEAEEILRTYRAPTSYAGHLPRDVGRAEHVGGLFIEWLRAYVSPTTHHHFGAISVKIGGGMNFEQAFQEELGLTLGLAEQRFLSFVAATDANPTERFRGMVFAGR